MNINTMTLEQLKVLAYDLMVQQQQVNNNLQVVNNKIAEFTSAPIKETKEEGEPKSHPSEKRKSQAS